jgi:hypothetical protein
LSLSSVGVFRPSALVFLVSVAITGIRYVFYPMCLLLILLVRNISTFPKKAVKVCLCIILIVVAFNSALQYEISPVVDFKFRSYAQEFDPDGHYSLFVPINPGWFYMRIPSSPELTASRLRSMTRIDAGNGAIDTMDGKWIHETKVVVEKCRQPFIVLTGWAINEEAKNVATTVYLVVDRNLAFPTSYGMSRPDVARSLGNPNYEHSGWLGTIPIENLTIGSHEVSIWIVSTGGRYYHVNDGVTFEVACVLAES